MLRRALRIENDRTFVESMIERQGQMWYND